MFLRNARRWWTAKAMHAARSAAAHAPLPLINIHEQLIARLGPRLPILAKLVSNNMKAAGVYSDEVFREHFSQLALHLANAMRVFRLTRLKDAVSDLARAQVDIDDSVHIIRELLNRGTGVVIAPPHVCNYLLTLTRLNQEFPVWVYLRWSDDHRKLEAKRTWCQAAGLPVIMEPPDAADPASRAAACVEVLREGRALVMTPDIAQKDGRGAAVRLCGHRAFLPTGPASIAMLAEAPFAPVFGRLAGGKHIIEVKEPIIVESKPRAEGGRKAGIQIAMQSWACHFDAFIRESPQAWYLWGDNRWTRVFRNDPRYGGVDVPETAAESPSATG